MSKLSLTMGMVILGAILLMGCKEKAEEAPALKEETAKEEKTLAGKRVVMIIAPENFRDEELIEPQDVLTDKGAVVKVASRSLEVSRGMLGAQVKPDMLISDVNPQDWDAIILVGGTGASAYWEDSTVHWLLKQAVAKDKIVGAICIAPVTMANAGILSGKRATVFASEESRLKDKGARCTGKNVERDGRVITASGPPAAREFGEVVAQALME